MTLEISNSDDIIDSRDVIKRIEELESLRDDAETDATKQEERDDLAEQIANATTDEEKGRLLDEISGLGEIPEKVWSHDGKREFYASDSFGEDEEEELYKLKELAEQGDGYGDWSHGATLIADSYFTKYAEELAEDLHGDKIRNAEWPFSAIDWERAANDLQSDYTQVDFDGETFWMRS